MWGHRGICADLVNIPFETCMARACLSRPRLNAAQSASERTHLCILEFIVWYFGSLRRYCYSSMSCDKCFECLPRCPRGADPSQKCSACLDDPLGERQAAGHYTAALGRASSVLANLSAPLTDKLLGYVGPINITAVLTVEEAAMLASKANAAVYDYLSMSNLNVALALNRKRPAEYAGIRQRLEGMLTDATVAAQVTKLETVLSIMAKDIDLQSKSVDTVITSATSYKENTFPLYMFWHSILKKVVVGQDTFEETEQKTLFDATTCKVHVPFEKMPKCKTPAHLFMAFAMFKEGITVLKQTAPCAWSGLQTQLFRTEATMGYAVAQQFVGEVLRRLDLGDFTNIVSLLANGEHNRILDDLRPPLQSLQDLSQNQQNQQNQQTIDGQTGSKRVKLGAVTKQGEFCSIIKGGTPAMPLLCNQFKQGTPCVAGVTLGQGHDQHVGKCAYHHE
jgi:hypothetical protein